MKYFAISFEEDGTAFSVMPSPREANDWLKGRRVQGRQTGGSQLIFEFDGELAWMDYDSYGETHVHSGAGEARCVYYEDSQTVNEDVYHLKGD